VGSVFPDKALALYLDLKDGPISKNPDEWKSEVDN
jgi:hypothetical protein